MLEAPVPPLDFIENDEQPMHSSIYAELYFELKPQSSNLGEVDYEALATGAPQQVSPNPNGHFRLFRIGDAVAARNTHAAIYDALRLIKDL